MARIVIDRIIGTSGQVEAEMVVHTEAAPWNVVENPDAPGQRIPALAFLRMLQARPALRASAGYDVETQNLGDPPGTTRWKHILDSGEL